MPDAPLWTPEEIANATSGRWLNDTSRGWNPQKLSYDTRGNMQGHICVLPHPRSWGKGRPDPSDRIGRLANQGAAAVILQEEHVLAMRALGIRLRKPLPICLVDDTFAALGDLARVSRRRFQGKVFALTGSVGKTTTREMLRHITDRQGGASATRANNNNIAGVHRSLAYMPRDAAAGVIEMGFGKPLNGIERSSRVAQPDVALITSISQAHFDMFTEEMLAQESGLDMLTRHKGAIFTGLAPGGTAVLNGHLPNLDLALRLARAQTDRVLLFGETPDHDAYPVSSELGVFGTKAKVSVGGEVHALTLKLPGKHMLMNALAALLAVHAAGFDTAQAAADMAAFEPVAGRGRVIDVALDADRTVVLIDDSFSATLASMTSTLELLALSKPKGNGRRIAVLGEIGHVGAREAEAHADLTPAVEQSGADLVFTWGPLMRPMFDALPEEKRGLHHDTSVSELYEAVFATLRDGDVITVKSGRGTDGLGDKPFMAFVRCLTEGRSTLEV